MEQLSTVVIWVFRLALPFILFFILFWRQSSQEEAPGGTSKRSYPRSKLLAQRKVVLDEGGPAPESVKTITLVGPERAPQFFVSGPSRGSRGGGGATRRSVGAPGGEERSEKRSTRAPKSDESEGKPPHTEGGQAVPAAPEEAPAPPKAAAEEPAPVVEEKVHLESLLNYVAFNRKEQQRTFLVDDAAAPPPPPPKPKPKDATSKEAEDSAVVPPPASVNTSNANWEAQMVLIGVKEFKRSDVARNLYEQLNTSQVEITEKTFKLMIETCVVAQDLKGASDFLVKMEACGHCPDSELLDMVMDLYTQQKTLREEKKEQEKPEKENPAEPNLPAINPPSDGHGHPVLDAVEIDPDAPRTKLSSEARLFIPSSQPPPPPPPPPPQDGEVSAADAEAQRTALKATSKPFQPQGVGNFGSYDQSWGMGYSNYSQEGKWDSRKDSVKSKAKAKSKDKAKHKENVEPTTSPKPRTKEPTASEATEYESKKPKKMVWTPKKT